MKHWLIRATLTFAWASTFTGCDAASPNASVQQQLAAGREPEILYLDSDRAFAVPIARARETVEQFVTEITSAYDKDARYEFRVLLEENGVAANVWVVVDPYFPQAVTQLVGNVVQVPSEWQHIQAGQPITQEAALVYDWRIIKNGIVRGAFTTRAIREQMTDAERQAFDGRTGLQFD